MALEDCNQRRAQNCRGGTWHCGGRSMKALRDVFGETLVSLGSSDPNVVVLDADLANSTKADKFAKMYPGRFLQMGIAEQNFVGVAVGLASLDFVPWLSTFTVFFTHRAIRSDPHVSRPDPRRCLPRCHLRFRQQWYPFLDLRE